MTSIPCVCLDKKFGTRETYTIRLPVLVLPHSSAPHALVTNLRWAKSAQAIQTTFSLTSSIHSVNEIQILGSTRSCLSRTRRRRVSARTPLLTIRAGVSTPRRSESSMRALVPDVALLRPAYCLGH